MQENFSVDSVVLKLTDYVNEGGKTLEVKLEFDCDGGINVIFAAEKHVAFSREEFDEIVTKVEPVAKLLWPGNNLYFVLNGHVK